MKKLSYLLCGLVVGLISGCTHGPFPLDESSMEPKWITQMGETIIKPYTVEFYRREDLFSLNRIKAVIKHDGGRKIITVWGKSVDYKSPEQPGGISVWIIEMNGIREAYMSPDQSTLLFLQDPNANNSEQSLLRIAFQRKEESLLALTSQIERFYKLDEVATSAYIAGEFEKAAAYASELVEMAGQHPKNWNYSNAVHKGNILLGRLDLRAGDIDKAKEHLLAAGKVSGSPQLDSFGPNMSLAKDLLEQGESKVVLEYLDLVHSFWDMDYGKIDEWKEFINKGQIPDFGANLVY